MTTSYQGTIMLRDKSPVSGAKLSKLKLSRMTHLTDEQIAERTKLPLRTIRRMRAKL